MMLVGAAFAVAAAWALGMLLPGAWRSKLSRMEAALLAFLSGSVCLAAVVWLLGLAHAARPAVLAVVGLGALAAALRLRAPAPQPRPPSPIPRPPRSGMLFAAALAVFVALYLLHAMMPDIAPDGPHHRLGEVAASARASSAPPLPVEAVYVYAYAFGGAAAPAVTHLSYLAALALLLVCFGRRIAMPKAGAVAAVLVFASPAAGIAGATASNTMAVAALAFAAFYLVYAGLPTAAIPSALGAALEIASWPGGPLAGLSGSAAERIFTATVAGGPHGLLGPAFLLAPIAVLALCTRAGRWTAVAGLALAPWGFPALPFLALAMGIAVNQTRYVAPALLVGHALLSWPDATALYAAPEAWRIRRVSLRAALRVTPEAEYLRTHLPGYPALRLAGQVPAGARIYSAGPFPQAYSTAAVVSSADLDEVLRTAVRPELQSTRRMRLRWNATPALGVRLYFAGAASVAEIRIIGEAGDEARELPRRPDWLLRARPGTPDVARAFDNSPVTLWRSAGPGVVEVEFGGLATIAGAALETVQTVPVRVELKTAAGWRAADASVETSAVTPPPMRRMAIQELRLHGIRYLLLPTEDGISRDLLVYSRAWGLAPVASEGVAHLLAIQ